MTRLEFEIDELVLIGFDPRERHRIGDALQQALAAQCLEAGLVSALFAHAPGRPLLHGADITLPSGARPEQAAPAIAASVAGALRGGTARRQEDR